MPRGSRTPTSVSGRTTTRHCAPPLTRRRPGTSCSRCWGSRRRAGPRREVSASAARRSGWTLVDWNRIVLRACRRWCHARTGSVRHGTLLVAAAYVMSGISICWPLEPTTYDLLATRSRRRASPRQDDDVPGERDMDLQRVALALHRRWPQGACRVRPVRDRRLRRRRRRSRCVPHPVGPADRRKKSVPPALRRSSCRHTMVDCSGNTCLWLSLSARAVSGSGRFSPVTGCGAVGSALVWGARGRGFKSRQPDHSDLDQEAGVHARHVWRSAAPRYVRPVVSREGRGG